MLWERDTSPDGQAYCIFELTADQVQRLGTRQAVALDGARVGLPVQVILTGGRAWDARRQIFGIGEH